MAERLGLLDAIDADIRRAIRNAADFSGDRPSVLRRLSVAATPAIMTAALHRVAHALHGAGWRRTARLAAWVNTVLHKCYLDPAASIGPGLYVPHPRGVIFRGRAGCNLTLYCRCHVVAAAAPAGVDDDAGAAALSPRFGDDVTVGMYSVVAGPVHVGDGVHVGARAVVYGDVAPGTVVGAPVPAVEAPRAAMAHPAVPSSAAHAREAVHA